MGDGDTHNQLGDVNGPAIQAGKIDQVTINMSGPAIESRIPREVPAVIGRFINRDVDFERVDALLSADARSVEIAVLSGHPGVGKSSFARRYAQRNVDRFTGGQLHVDLAGNSGTPQDVLTRLLISLGVAPEVIPVDLLDKVNLYRSLTGRRPMLIVVDRAIDTAVIRNLVPSAPGSVVLVTSNDQLTDLLGAQRLALEPLNGKHGAYLLAQYVGDRIGKEPEATEQLVKQCGGLPVALCVAAARLRSRPALTVAHLVAEIAERGLRGFKLAAGENQVAAVFTSAYQALPDEVARLYRQVGLLPLPEFSLELAVAATGLPTAVVEERLGSLVETSLLTEEALHRYRFHSLLWRHAREQAEAIDTEEDRVAVLRQAVDHVLRTAAFADLAAHDPERLRCTPHATLLDGYDDPFTDTDRKAREKRALDWLDDERGMAQALLETATDHGWFDAAWQLAESMTALFLVRRYLADWTVFTALGVRAAQAAQAPAAEARLRSFVSRAWTDLGNPARAEQELRTALTLAEHLDHPRLLASIREMWARWYDNAGDHTRAQATYHQAGELFNSADDRRGSAYVWYFLGTSLAAQQQWQTARDVLTEARDRIHALQLAGSDRMEGRAWLSLGPVQQQLGRPEEAIAAVHAALTLFVDGEYTFYEAKAHETLADLAEQRGDTAELVAGLRRTLELTRQLNSPRAEELRTRLERAELTLHQSDPNLNPQNPIGEVPGD